MTCVYEVNICRAFDFNFNEFGVFWVSQNQNRRLRIAIAMSSVFTSLGMTGFVMDLRGTWSFVFEGRSFVTSGIVTITLGLFERNWRHWLILNWYFRWGTSIYQEQCLHLRNLLDLLSIIKDVRRSETWFGANSSTKTLPK